MFLQEIRPPSHPQPSAIKLHGSLFSPSTSHLSTRHSSFAFRPLLLPLLSPPHTENRLNKQLKTSKMRCKYRMGQTWLRANICKAEQSDAATGCSPSPKSPSSAECKLPRRTRNAMAEPSRAHAQMVARLNTRHSHGTRRQEHTKPSAKGGGWNQHHFPENYRSYCKVTDGFICQHLTSKANLLSQTHQQQKEPPPKKTQNTEELKMSHLTLCYGKTLIPG